MSLQDRIQADLTAAMKARERLRTSALRMLIAAMKNAAVEARLGPQGTLPDEEVERLLGREIKRRREAADAFRAAGREEQAASEEAEARLYAEYLPQPLTDDELQALVDVAVAETGAQGPQQMGQVMRVLMPRVGSRAEGSRVSAMVRSRLQG